MSVDAFLALLVYAFVTSITPGPNNLMLLASGVNFGFVRTIPHMLGIGGGFLVLLLAVGFGLGAVLTAFPSLHLALKIAGGAYLLYLAWRIAMSRSMAKDGETKGRPMTFLEAAAFQWVNPKAWVMAVGAMAIYANPQAPFLSVLADLGRVRGGQPAERLDVGRFRHRAARLPRRPGAAQMVQHRDGRAARRDALADVAVTAQRRQPGRYKPDQTRCWATRLRPVAAAASLAEMNGRPSSALASRASVRLTTPSSPRLPRTSLSKAPRTRTSQLGA